MQRTADCDDVLHQVIIEVADNCVLEVILERAHVEFGSIYFELREGKLFYRFTYCIDMHISLVPLSILTIFSKQQVVNSFAGMEKRLKIITENDRLNEEEYQEWREEKHKNPFYNDGKS